MTLVYSTKRDWETDFTEWSRPPGQGEHEKSERAIAAIKKAIAKSSTLASHNISVFTQGSFRNRTNVRKDSDVDVCILCSDTIIIDYPPGVTDGHTGLGPASYDFTDFKNDVGAALTSHFGRDHVTRGKKAFDIHENTYRIDADVVPCFEFRKFFVASGVLYFHTGTALFPDGGGTTVTNFPEQQYQNGTAKNDATSRRFKKAVRIIKRLKNEMKTNGILQAIPIPSYLIECLVWNVPNNLFVQLSLKQMVMNVLENIWTQTKTDNSSAYMFEENGIKLLFGAQPEWTRQQVNDFAAAAWNYVESQ